MLLDELPGVEESAVIGVPHPDFGEAVVAVIAYVKDRLANFKVPKQVHIVDALPRNTMGKVQKNVLRESFGRA